MFDLVFMGLYLGAIHLFSAPDHLLAIIPLSLLDQRKTWRIGLFWGIGHLIGLSITGVLLYYFKSFITLHFFEDYGILYISILLIIVGLWIIQKSKTFNLHNVEQEQSHLSKITFGTGVFHGIFAISHIYSLAPTISMNNSQFFAYFGSFAVGSVASIVLFSSLISQIPKRFTSSQNFFKKLILGNGILTFLIGIVLTILFFAGISTHLH